MGRKKKKVVKAPPEDVYAALCRENIRRITKAAFSGKFDERGRAVLAREVAFIKASQAFTKVLKDYLWHFNTNLGLLLEESAEFPAKDDYPDFPTSMTLPGTGDEGADEFILLQLNAKIGKVDSYDEHVELLRKYYTVREKYEEALCESTL